MKIDTCWQWIVLSPTVTQQQRLVSISCWSWDPKTCSSPCQHLWWWWACWWSAWRTGRRAARRGTLLVPVTSSVTSTARRQMRTSLRCIGTYFHLIELRILRWTIFWRRLTSSPGRRPGWTDSEMPSRWLHFLTIGSVPKVQCRNHKFNPQNHPEEPSLMLALTKQ